VPAALGAVTIYPAGNARVGGTLADGGLYGPFDGVADTWDWTFNGIGGFEGVLTLSQGSAARPAEQRVVWEYDVSALSTGAPFTAFVVFELRGPPIFPFPDVPVSVFAYPADLREDPSDYAVEATPVASAEISPFTTRGYQLNITPAIVNALDTSDGRIGLRFQIDPDSPFDSNQAFMDISDADDMTKPAIYVPTTVLGDADRNGVIEVSDFATFPECMGGPDDTVSSSCLIFDFDADFDVDAADAAWFAVTHSLFAQQ
jgi:hypothetical protein